MGGAGECGPGGQPQHGVPVTKEDRAGWVAWGGIILFAVIYGIVTLWVIGMVGKP